MTEYAELLIQQYLFPTPDEVKILTLPEFVKRLEACNFLLIDPKELRKKYTQYVYLHRQRAMLPVRSLQKVHIKRERRNYMEESKQNISLD